VGFVYFLFHILHLVVTVLSTKVKNDHRSKLSNLSSWKEDARKKKIRASRGFEPVTSAIPVTGSNPSKPCFFFFRLLLSSKIYCDDHSLLSSTTAEQT